MEGLNVAMKSSIQNSLYSGIDIPNHGPSVSHLFYADDAIFISDWSYSNFSDLSNILKCSHFSLGLKVNFHKSKVFGIGVPTSDVISCAHIIGCEVVIFPFTYLGVQSGLT